METSMKLVVRAFLMTGILILAACGASGAAQGGGSEYGNYGQVKIGVPF